MTFTAMELPSALYRGPSGHSAAGFFFHGMRVYGGAMIITTNKTVRDRPELLAGEDVLATAILDRSLHRAHVPHIRGRSYRLRNLEASLKN